MLSPQAIASLVAITAGIIIKCVSMFYLGYYYSALRTLDKQNKPTTSTTYRKFRKKLLYSGLGVIIGAILSNGVWSYIQNTTIYDEIIQLIQFIHH